ncbi:MAG TPA: hypothetical protein VKF80_10610 [Candidatus Eisenbacteria bacterium]|nr:hypothetical protein [Candidatus Eisenbacteria bacterium]
MIPPARKGMVAPHARKGMIPNRSKPKKASEGLLLLVLLLSVLITVMSMLMTRHPAVGVFQPLSETESGD